MKKRSRFILVPMVIIILILNNTNTFAVSDVLEKAPNKLDASTVLTDCGKTFGGSQQDEIWGENALLATNDNGYIITGGTESFGNRKECLPYSCTIPWIVKTDADRNILWKRTIGDDIVYAIEASYVYQTSDNGFLIAITFEYPGFWNALVDFELIKIDSSGNIQWAKNFRDEQDSVNVLDSIVTDNEGNVASMSLDGTDYYLSHIEEMIDGNFDLLITTQANGGGWSDIRKVRIDTKGNIISSNIFDGNGLGWAEYVSKTNDGGFIVADNRRSTISDDEIDCAEGAHENFRVLKYNNNGKKIWQREFCTDTYKNVKQIIPSRSNGHFVTGDTGSNNVSWECKEELNCSNVWVIKLDSKGEVLWDMSFGEEYNETPMAALNTHDDGIIIAALEEPYVDKENCSSHTQCGNTVITKINSQGEMSWQRKVVGNKYHNPSAMIHSSDDGIVIAGNAMLYGYDGSDIWLMKLNSQGDCVW